MIRIGLMALAFVLAPTLGAAQDAPAGMPPAVPDAASGSGAPPAPNPARMAAMRAVREQMETLHKQTRLAMLASLTPQHRQQLATLIGQFAISANPDRQALERSVDALLTRNEAQSIVNLAASERTNSRSLMEAARAQMEASMTADERARMQARDAQMASRGPRAMGMASARTPDPGAELLRTIVAAREPHGMPGMGREGWHGGPPPDAPHQ
jgi:hypothetical protein